MIRLLTQTNKQIMLEYHKRNEVETSFLYANIIECGVDNRKELRRCADYYGYFDGENLKGILPFYNLGSCIPHYEDNKAVPLFAGLMKERNFEFLLGMQKVIKPIFEEVKTSKEIVSYSESSYFINRKFKPYILDGLNFINANGESGDEVVESIIYARANGFNEVVTKEGIMKSLAQRSKEEEFLIAVKDGEIVTQACIQAYTSQFKQIGGVYTAEKERGKGYCKATVSELCRRIIAEGKIPTLSVKKNNTPAVRAYSALGFEHYDDYLIIRFSQGI